MAGCLKTAVKMPVKHEIAGLYEKMSASRETLRLFVLTVCLWPCNDGTAAPYRFVKHNVYITCKLYKIYRCAVHRHKKMYTPKYSFSIVLYSPCVMQN